jgi:multidrug efflux pump subunit AcrB
MRLPAWATSLQPGRNGLDLGKAPDKEEEVITVYTTLGMTVTNISDQVLDIRDEVGEFRLKFIVALVVVIAVSGLAIYWPMPILVFRTRAEGAGRS